MTVAANISVSDTSISVKPTGKREPLWYRMARLLAW